MHILPARKLHIVIVEDDPLQSESLALSLRNYGHEVRVANSGQTMDALLRQAPADIILLDLGLPNEDGLDIATRLRPHWRGGIAIISARGQTEDRILGHEAGADLYFVKPVEVREIASALQNLAARLEAPPKASWQLEAAASLLITPLGIPIPLTAQEYLLLERLLEQKGKNISRDIFFKIFAYPDTPSADLRLEGLISRLRTKVRKKSPRTPLPICARYNKGYAFLTTDTCALLSADEKMPFIQ